MIELSPLYSEQNNIHISTLSVLTQFYIFCGLGYVDWVEALQSITFETGRVFIILLKLLKLMIAFLNTEGCCKSLVFKICIS